MDQIAVKNETEIQEEAPRENCCQKLDKLAIPLPKGLPTRRTRYSTVCGAINTVILIVLFILCTLYATREIILIFSDDAEIISTPIVVETDSSQKSEIVEIIPDTETATQDTADDTTVVIAEEDKGSEDVATDNDKVVKEQDAQTEEVDPKVVEDEEEEVVEEVDLKVVEDEQEEVVEETPIEDLLRVAQPEANFSIQSQGSVTSRIDQPLTKSTFQDITQTDYFDSSELTSVSEGNEKLYNLAYAFVDLKDLNWSIGYEAVELISVQGSETDEGVTSNDYSPLGSHSCSRAELGLDATTDESEVKFYETKSSDQLKLLERHATRMLCLDQPFSIKGNSDTLESQLVRINISYSGSGTTFAQQVQLAGKTMLVLINERSLVNNVEPNLIFDERSRVIQSRINYQSPIGTILQLNQGETQLSVTQADGQSETTLTQLSSFSKTEMDLDIFHYGRDLTKPLIAHDITIERSLNFRRVQASTTSASFEVQSDVTVDSTVNMPARDLTLYRIKEVTTADTNSDSDVNSDTTGDSDATNENVVSNDEIITSDTQNESDVVNDSVADNDGNANALTVDDANQSSEDDSIPQDTDVSVAENDSTALDDSDPVDLSDVDLSDVDLSGVDLSGVDLSGVDLSGVDLSGVDLSGDQGAEDVNLNLSDFEVSGDQSTGDLPIDLSDLESLGDNDLEALLAGEGSGDNDLEALLAGEGSGDNDLEALLAGEGSGDIDLEALLAGEGSGDIDLEALLAGEGNVFEVDNSNNRMLQSAEPELEAEEEEDEEWWRWEMPEKYLLAGRWVADLGGVYIILLVILMAINYLLTGCCFCMYVAKERRALSGQEVQSGPFDRDAEAIRKQDEADERDMTTRHLYIGDVSAVDPSNSHSQYHKRLPDENNGEFPDTIEIAKDENEKNSAAAISQPREDFDLLKETNRDGTTDQPSFSISKETKDRKKSPTEMREALYKVEEEEQK